MKLSRGSLVIVMVVLFAMVAGMISLAGRKLMSTTNACSKAGITSTVHQSTGNVK